LGAVDQIAQHLWQKAESDMSMEPVSAAVKVPLRIKNKYLETALQRVSSPELLVNVVRRRVRQLVAGYRPITQTDARMEFSDIALKEISEGKLTYELDSEAEVVAETPDAIVVPPSPTDTLAA
jgi:DNA-directed RNA polymerase subunit omega